MVHIVAGLFTNSKIAGEAIAELKQAGFTDQVSVISKNWEDSSINTATVKTGDVGATGAVTGAVMGGLAGLIVGAVSLAIPGIGSVLVAGPFATLMGASGAIAGGLIGFLVGIGIPQERAGLYEGAIKRGQVLGVISTDHENEAKVTDILEKHGVNEVYTNHEASF